MNSLLSYIKDRVKKEQHEEVKQAKARAQELHNFENLILTNESDSEDGEITRSA